MLASRRSEPSHLVSTQDVAFLDDRLQDVPGWLFQPASILSTFLIRSLGDAGNSAIAEIGVFHGKFLACLRNAAGRDWQVIGLDTFQWVPKETVDANFAGLFGPDHGVDFWSVDTQTLAGMTLASRLRGAKLRFASVDGDHRAEAVYKDLELIESVLADDGIIAADDFLNPLALGATEGLATYLRQSGDRLVPFAFGGNKLFLCRPDRRTHNQALVRQLIIDAPQLSGLDEARKIQSLGESYFCQDLGNGPCLVLSTGLTLRDATRTS